MQRVGVPMVAFLSKTAKNGGIQLAPGVPVRAGQVLSGRYRVEELLGCSATAVVVTARHVHTREPVTVKILSAYTDDQLDLVKRQIKKARIASRLRGDHVARIKDIGTTEDGMPYIVTERLEGRTLASELERRGGKLPIEDALRLVVQVCEGLAEAHSVGLVHGDLKLRNLFLTEEGVVKVLDFGMASPIETAGDASATAYFGMPSYLAPEQITDPSRVDARADVWALGVILHELVSGELPFTADTVSGVLVAVCFDAPPLLGDAPYELAKLVHRCLEKDAANRPASVGELADAIAPFLGSEGARTSERIRAALAPRALDDLDAADPDDSIAPMSVPRADPGAKQRGQWPRVTVPSQRVLAARQLLADLDADSRQARVRGIALGTIVAATAIAAAAIIVSPPASPTAAALASGWDEDVVIPSSREPFEVPAVVPPSFAAEPEPPHAAPVAVKPRPRPRPHRATRLPPGLPTTREALVPSRGLPKRDHDEAPSRRSGAPPSLPAPRTDPSYLRSLFSEPK